MARPKTDVKLKKVLTPLTFKVTEDEKKQILEEVEKSGMDRSEFIRQKILKNKMVINMRSNSDVETVKNLIKIGGNLNQLMAIMNTKIKVGNESDFSKFEIILNQLVAALDEVRDIRKLLR